MNNRNYGEELSIIASNIINEARKVSSIMADFRKEIEEERRVLEEMKARLEGK